MLTVLSLSPLLAIMGVVCLKLRGQLSLANLVVFVAGAFTACLLSALACAAYFSTHPLTQDPGSRVLGELWFSFLLLLVASALVGGLATVKAKTGLMTSVSSAPESEKGPGLTPPQDN